MAVKVPTWLENKEGDRVISISKIHKDVGHLSITAEDGKFGTFCNLFYAGSDRFYSFVARNVHLFFCCCIQMFIYYFAAWFKCVSYSFAAGFECFLFFFAARFECFLFFFLIDPNVSFQKYFCCRIEYLKKILFTGGSKPFYLFFSSSETECIFTLLLLESPTLSYCFLYLLRITVAYLDLH